MLDGVDEAQKWLSSPSARFQLSSSARSNDALCNLGACYYDGFPAGNVPKDRIEGLSLLRMAVEKGNKNAKEILFRTARASFQRKSWMFSASRLAG